ncbi:MAG TPA: hypothetical protein VG826_23255 [Pirellulales bacterium]|nr:hypothetical protein [Pirellulales bacterium]
MKHIEDEGATSPERGATIELLGRLPGAGAAQAPIEALPGLPREDWAKARRTLEKLTAKRFGPKTGDGLAQVKGAQKKWGAWLDEQKTR